MFSDYAQEGLEQSIEIRITRDNGKWFLTERKSSSKNDDGQNDYITKDHLKKLI